MSLNVILKKIVLTLGVSNFLVVFFLKLHNLLNRIIVKFAIIDNGGLHPKHHIQKYKEWFCSFFDKHHVVLDIGCNTGEMSRLASQYAKEIHAIEINEDNYKKAIKQPRSNVKYYRADATQFDYSQLPAIDFVILSNVLEHVEERVDFLKALRRIKQTSPQLKYLIRVPCRDRDWITMYKIEKGVYWKLDATHFTEYTQSEFEEELSVSGYKIQSLHIKFGEIYAVCV